MADHSSRRTLLKQAVALGTGLGAGLGDRTAFAQTPNSGSSLFVYVGTYTPPRGPGEGIYLFRMDPATGALAKVKVFPGVNSPTWLTIHPNKRYIYSASENQKIDDPVTAFSINASNGDLTMLNTAASQGDGGTIPAMPVYVSMHPSGKYLFAANWGSGNTATFPILENGELGKIIEVKKSIDVCASGPCTLGPMKPTNGPPEGFPVSWHDRGHAHMILSDPSGKYVLVNDMGFDMTIIWKFDANTGKLSDPKTVAATPGSGPRHFAFHQNGRFFYSVTETASTLTFMTWNGADGTLVPKKEISVLPANYVGTGMASEIILSKDGRFAYVCNRQHDSIAILEIDANGMPTLIGEEWTRGNFARGMHIDPTGKYLYACNQRSDAIATFSIDGNGRNVKFTGRYTAVPQPAVMAFL